MIGQNLLTQKNTVSKWSVNAFYCVNGLHVGLCILNIPMWGKHHCRITKEIAILVTRIKSDEKLLIFASLISLSKNHFV